MSKVARVNATLDKDLLARVDEYAARHREDRSTAIRQLLDAALRSLAERDAIAAYQGGRITLRELAATLNLSVWNAHDFLAARGVAIAQGTLAETASDLASLVAESAPAAPRRSPPAKGRGRERPSRSVSKTPRSDERFDRR